jgi:hypothetical protein
MTKDGHLRRLSRWYGGRLFGLSAFGEFASRNMESGLDTGREAIDALRPKGRLQWGSFGERYADGGIARFRELTEGRSAQEIAETLATWDRDSSIYTIGGTAALLAIPVLFVAGFQSLYMLIGSSIWAIMAFALAAKADFRAWQIRQGRVGSVGDYVRGRLPANMQILPGDKE